jgi:copper chaperone NosL
MPERFPLLGGLLLLLLLAACSGDPGSGPKEVKWDRDACERCRMVLSDRHYSAQVRVFPEGKRSKVFFFDDIGCATLWLEDKPWMDDPRTEIWVTDHRKGEWIDARTATYVKEKITPMEYGLGAQTEPAPGGLDFEQAKRHIVEVEERFTIRGVQLLDRLKEQAERRAAAQRGKL